MPARGTKSIRGRNKLTLLHMLADDELTQEEMGKQLGYTRAMVATFKARNLDQIEAIRADRTNEFAGLWIADRKERVAEYEEDVERVKEWLDSGELAPEDAPPLLRIKQSALRNTAEELGHLKQHVVSEERHEVKYITENTDDEELK
jgi:hypothetical protein